MPAPSEIWAPQDGQEEWAMAGCVAGGEEEGGCVVVVVRFRSYLGRLDKIVIGLVATLDG